MRLVLLLLVACSSPKQPPAATPPAKPAPNETAKQPAPTATPKTAPGCPAAEPNINGLCTKPGLECTYGASRCPPVYVCTKQRRFEAQFRPCPR